MEVKLVIVGGKLAGKEIAVRTRQFLIGRGQECQLRPQSHSISRKHCVIFVDENGAAIEDLKSTNGTFVNGQRIEKRQELKNGDRIKVGLLELEAKLLVSVSGAMKPKVHNVHEAAARVVAAASSPGDDLDISSWLENDDNDPDAETVTWPTKKPSDADETLVGKALTETTTSHGSPPKKTDDAEKTKGKKPVKPVGRFQNRAKPAAESSGEAAGDMLKQFFSRKR